MAAKQSELSELHLMLTELFMEDIRICRTEGIPMSASDKAVIVKFLKDNSVTADVDDESMQALRDEFKDELAARRQAKAQSILAPSADDDLLSEIVG